MMKFRLNACFGLLAALLIVLFVGATAHAAVISTSGTADPTSNGFAKVWDTNNVSAGSTDSEAHWGMSTSAGAGSSGYLGSFAGSGSASASGWTATMRAKVITSTTADDANLIVITGTGSTDPGWNWAINVQADGVHAYNASGSSPLIYAMDPTDGYHDYQMVWDGNGGAGANGGTVGVYVDGSLVSTLTTSQMFVNWGEQLRWGDTVSSTGQASDVQYSLVQFETGNTVIPEPSTLALLGLGLVGFMGYGRKKQR